MRRRPRSATSCSAMTARKRAAGQPSLSDCSANCGHNILMAGSRSSLSNRLRRAVSTVLAVFMRHLRSGWRRRGVDPLGVAGIAAADDLVAEAAIGGEIIEVGSAAQQQGIGDRPLEMAMRALDRPVLVGDAAVVAGRPHAVMGAELLVPPGSDRP